MKIAVFGFSGAGKSTLAKQLGERLHIPVLHLDQVHWLPGWQERKREESLALVAETMRQSDWIIEGNYSKFEWDARVEEADYLIYMNFSRWRCLYGIVKRYLQNRGKVRESMTEGCPEKLDWEFIWWTFWKGRKKSVRRHYTDACSSYVEKAFVCKSRRAARQALEQICAAQRRISIEPQSSERK